MKKTRPKSYIVEDDFSLLYIINPKSTEKGRPAEQEVVLVPRPEGSSIKRHILDLLEDWVRGFRTSALPGLGRDSPHFLGFGGDSSQVVPPQLGFLRTLHPWPPAYPLQPPTYPTPPTQLLLPKSFRVSMEYGGSSRETTLWHPGNMVEQPLKARIWQKGKTQQGKKKGLREFSLAHKWQWMKDGGKERGKAFIYRQEHRWTRTVRSHVTGNQGLR